MHAHPRHSSIFQYVALFALPRIVPSVCPRCSLLGDLPGTAEASPVLKYLVDADAAQATPFKNPRATATTIKNDI